MGEDQCLSSEGVIILLIAVSLSLSIVLYLLILTSGTVHCFAGFEVFCILAYLTPLQDQAYIIRVTVLFVRKVFTNGLVTSLFGFSTYCKLLSFMLCGVC